MNNQEEKIKREYLNGLKYAEIEKNNNITHSQLISFIQKNNLKRDKKYRSQSQKGNKNAIGNKGGHAPKKNKNAVTTGEFENIFDTFLDNDEKRILSEEYEIDEEIAVKEELKLIIIRERRMMERIQNLKSKQHDMLITKMEKNSCGTATELQNTLYLINRIEEGLTRLQETKRRLLDLLHTIKKSKESGSEKSTNIVELVDDVYE